MILVINVFNRFSWFFLLFFSIVIISCKEKSTSRLFTPLDPKTSGINFSNNIHDDSSYSFINEFGYMGGGVGIGDFNNDGLKDIVFTGNQVSSKIYINKGKNQFEDISEAAGIQTGDWCTGVSIADTNGDGYDDIYICVFGKNLKQRAKNLLFINQQNLTFKEEAVNYGIADTGYSSQAAFLDYDKDGDLDIYLANYLLSAGNSNTVFPRDKSGFSKANDVLYRNDGDSANTGHPHFTNVNMVSGIKDDGYGLGVSVSDFNNDGWPDIYVANDFVSSDLLWQNNRDGSFTNIIANAVQHHSYSSMGSDAADINNDTLADIVTLDMLPETNFRKKTSFSFMNYERYELERRMGYEPAFMRNMLQLNTGIMNGSNTGFPLFSEIGRLSGMYATDWSWSVLLADFDNDGWKDMHITNGIGRDFINADFLEFSSDIFNSYQSREEQQKAIQKKLASLDHVNLPNYLYINNRNLTFTDNSEAAGINESSMSNGAAYADLDNDGDLDLIVNNINKQAYVFLNNTYQANKPSGNHFLKINLEGDSLNRRGFGSKITVHTKNNLQVQEQNPVRGYLSSVDQQLLFGLGQATHVDSLTILWPDGKRQSLQNLSADTTINLAWKNASLKATISNPRNEFLFEEITTTAGFSYLHRDYSFNDYAKQRLLPQKYSQLGPFISAGDFDKDGAEDFFIGGANFSGKIFTQTNNSTFKSKNLGDSLKFEEDNNTASFDADGDGDLDLLITSGGMQYEDSSVNYKPRLYLNDGKGNFTLQALAIPDHARTIAGCVTTGDYDKDGDLDVFIGGRVSQQYPMPPHSFLLQNNKGIFKDVTASVSPALERIGMTTAAIWTDFDNDRQTDLVVTGEWMPIQFFKNNNGRLTDVTASTGLAGNNGMWRSLVATDLDNDGDIDFVAGNIGENCEYKTSSTQPMELFATDYDNNGRIDPFLFYYIKTEDGKMQSFPGSARARFSEQVPAIKKQYLLNEDFARAGYNDIFKNISKEKIQRFSCEETRSAYFENQGNGKFVKHYLPVEAQFSPVNAIVCEDFNKDGIKDLLLAGNEYQAEVMTGRYDASFGCLLLGSPGKTFRTVANRFSGFWVVGDVKDMRMVEMKNKEKLLMVAVNNDSMRVFKLNPAANIR